MPLSENQIIIPALMAMYHSPIMKALAKGIAHLVHKARTC
jgi:hypothetical protein